MARLLSFVFLLCFGLGMVGCDSKPTPAQIPSKENWKPIPKINGKKAQPPDAGGDKADDQGGKPK
jgi:hypothetical protein